MNRMDFTQAVARIRVLEKRLLNKNTFDRMLEAASKDDALKVLQAKYNLYLLVHHIV